jgi:hypothetical protein
MTNANICYLLSAICDFVPARVASCAPNLDVYGSYFPAWLICLSVGVISAVLVSLVGQVFDFRLPGIFRPLIPVSLILIFSVTTWLLFFAS